MLEITAVLEIILASGGLALGIAFLIISVDTYKNKKHGVIFILLGLLQTLTYYTASLYAENMVSRIIDALSMTAWLLSIMVNAIKLFDQENK